MTSPANSRRIFWLGMHKLLIRTELPRLRELGFEVYCPNNLSENKEHQSASNGWSVSQPTTLPKEIFDELSRFDFFNSPISNRIASILNKYFSAIVVTIDPGWLSEVVRVYHGKIIYRTYGHVVNMSYYLFKNGVMRAIRERDNFWYVPHAQESANHESGWLCQRMIVAPYCLGQESLDNLDQWSPEQDEIMLTCPNIANPYYLEHFKYLKQNFNEPQFKYYGVQTHPTKDENLVGTIAFAELMQKFKKTKGFLYSYKSPMVCFLPPIEMMITGGPVIYFKGSLLDQYFNMPSPPGRALDEKHARELCQRLLSNDFNLIQEIQESQRKVRERYMPEFVWPIFDRVFNEILSDETSNKGNKNILNYSAYLRIKKSDDEIIFANTCSMLRSKFNEHVVLGGRIAKQVIDYLASSKSTGRRVLFVRKRKLAQWLEVIGDERIDLIVCFDSDYPAFPSIKKGEPDRTQSKFKRMFLNPRWALLKIRQILLKKVRQKSRFRRPRIQMPTSSFSKVKVFSKRPLK